MSEAELPPSATVTYEFHDSSVPPPFHRSFVLTFDRTQARIVVDSYGSVLADRTASMSPEAWDRVAAGYPDVSALMVADPGDSCTGSTGFSTTIADDRTVRFTLSGLACGEVNSETAERLAAWVGPVRSLFPPMGELAPE